MPHLQFEINKHATDYQKTVFAARIQEIFGELMDTGTDHVAVTIRAVGRQDLSFRRASAASDGIAFVNADIRDGRSAEQKRRLAVTMIDELGAVFDIPPANVYVIYTEHPGEHFQFHDRVLPGWTDGEDPLSH